uniref:Uncharacterized protein n=1 Tax=Oryza barthii TaxID=65489 RepID=A0A0D3GVX9_9ORYZ
MTTKAGECGAGLLTLTDQALRPPLLHLLLLPAAPAASLPLSGRRRRARSAPPTSRARAHLSPPLPLVPHALPSLLRRRALHPHLPACS